MSAAPRPAAGNLRADEVRSTTPRRHRLDPRVPSLRRALARARVASRRARHRRDARWPPPARRRIRHRRVAPLTSPVPRSSTHRAAPSSRARLPRRVRRALEDRPGRPARALPLWRRARRGRRRRALRLRLCRRRLGTLRRASALSPRPRRPRRTRPLRYPSWIPPSRPRRRGVPLRPRTHRVAGRGRSLGRGARCPSTTKSPDPFTARRAAASTRR